MGCELTTYTFGESSNKTINRYIVTILMQHTGIIIRKKLKKANLPEKEGRKAMSLPTVSAVHGRQVARHPFCGPRLTEWRKRIC